MRPSWIRRVLVGVTLSSVLGLCAPAQSAPEEGKRKVKTRGAPAYPELARRMNVTGRVKIEVIITPDGRVKSTRAMGGHPLLVHACLDAVKEWKFVAASEETTQVIEFEFSGNNCRGARNGVLRQERPGSTERLAAEWRFFAMTIGKKLYVGFGSILGVLVAL